MTELEVTCLPADLPEHIEVDLSKLVKGDTIHLSAITAAERPEPFAAWPATTR